MIADFARYALCIAGFARVPSLGDRIVFKVAVWEAASRGFRCLDSAFARVLTILFLLLSIYHSLN